VAQTPNLVSHASGVWIHRFPSATSCDASAVVAGVTLGAALDLLDSFLDRYVKEYDYYEQAGHLAAQTLESNLQAAGIRSIVTSRAKSVTRLAEKCRHRNKRQNYESIDDIYADIVDLAGVRVALYFPGEREQVGGLISRLSDPLRRSSAERSTSCRALSASMCG